MVGRFSQQKIWSIEAKEKLSLLLAKEDGSGCCGRRKGIVLPIEVMPARAVIVTRLCGDVMLSAGYAVLLVSGLCNDNMKECARWLMYLSICSSSWRWCMSLIPLT